MCIRDSFEDLLKSSGVKKLVIKNVQTPNQIHLVVTSLSKYGETKKNLSDLESSTKPFPTLIIVNEVDFLAKKESNLSFENLLKLAMNYLDKESSNIAS